MPERVLGHLHQDRIAGLQRQLDPLGLPLEARRIPVDLAGVQHGVAAASDVHEGGLHRRQDVLDLAQVDVADHRARAGAVHVVLDEDPVLEDGDLGPVAALPDAHDAIHGLTAGQELGLRQDRRPASTRVPPVTPTLLLGLDPCRAAHGGDLVGGLPCGANLHDGVRRIVAGEDLHLLGDPRPAAAAPAPTSPRALLARFAGVRAAAGLVALRPPFDHVVASFLGAGPGFGAGPFLCHGRCLAVGPLVSLAVLSGGALPAAPTPATPAAAPGRGLVVVGVLVRTHLVGQVGALRSQLGRRGSCLDRRRRGGVGGLGGGLGALAAGSLGDRLGVAEALLAGGGGLGARGWRRGGVLCRAGGEGRPRHAPAAARGQILGGGRLEDRGHGGRRRPGRFDAPHGGLPGEGHGCHASGGPPGTTWGGGGRLLTDGLDGHRGDIQPGWGGGSLIRGAVGDHGNVRGWLVNVRGWPGETCGVHEAVLPLQLRLLDIGDRVCPGVRGDIRLLCRSALLEPAALPEPEALLGSPGERRVGIFRSVLSAFGQVCVRSRRHRAGRRLLGDRGTGRP